MSEHPHQPDQPPPASSNDGGSVVKPFLDHLEDLRWMLVKMFSVVGVAMVGCFWFARELMSVMIWPLERVTGGDAKPYLRTLEVTGGFMLAMKLALWTGIIIAGPLLMYFLGQFLLPALTRQEKRLLWPAFAAGGGLFIGGVALAYFAALPAGLR
ncbi:twin-arginine translocase subunit TatC, partial [bacterium]|nr:twin-arginine translocase subunit TatC [bacterium]